MNIEKITFKNYYKNSKEPRRSTIMYQVCMAFEISVSTFYSRMRQDRWTRLQRAELNRIFEQEFAEEVKH